MDDQQSSATEMVGRESGMQLFYANASRNLGGGFDVRIEFGYQRGSDEADWVAGVVMSWEHAQALANSLGKMLKEFQERAGTLPDVTKAGAIAEAGQDD